jgi:hypothetical protein
VAETTQNNLDQNPETFLSNLFDRRVYHILANENAAVGLFDRPAHPWPNTSVIKTDTHFSGALFDVNTVEVARDRFRRSKERWTGQVAIVLDDIGTKAKRPPVMPTAIIETGPGNEQWIFAFNRIERDAVLVETILQSAIAGGLTDPEAGGITRITRLPRSLPEGKTHRARLVWADWSRRFNPDVLIEKGFQVARVTPASPAPIGELRLCAETTAEGRSTLDRACQAIREAVPGTRANTIYRKANFIGRNVAAGLIALDEAEPALLSAAMFHDQGEGHARNGLRDGLKRPLAIEPEEAEAWGPATYPAPTGTVFDARRRVAEAFEAWAERALSYDPEAAILPPPVMAVRVSTGVGKSYSARRATVDLVRTLRAAGDARAVALAVPRHNLAEEYIADLAEIAPDLVVQSYRGRSAPDPEAEGETMCRRADEAAEVQKAHGDVRSTLCRQGNDRCPFFEVCGHNRQRAAHADIWIVPHANLWQAKPAMIEPAALVIDEDPTQGAFGGFGAPVRLALDELAMPLTIRLDDAGTADLAELSGRVASALRAGGDRVSLAAIKAEGLTTDDLAEARRLAFKAKIAPDARPSTPAADLAERLAQIGPHNRQALRRARLFGIIKEANEAGLETVPGLVCETAKGKDGETFRAVRMRWRNEIATGWTVPTLIASATARPEVLRAIWPHLSPPIDAEAAMPHVNFRQITDRQFGAASLAPVEHAGSAAHAFARNTRRRLRRYIEARAAEIGGRVLVIAQQAVIDLLRAEGLPAGVATVHFNALSGLDQWRDARLIIVIGRPMPAPAAVEDMAEVLTFSPIERVSGWYPVRAAHLDMRGTGEGPAIATKRGKGAEATPGAPYHPDPLAEAIRWQICEGELLQAIGRGRGVNRDANSPLQIDVLCNLPLPIAVDEAAAFETFEPTPAALMQARGFEVLDTSAKGAWAVVAAILPDVFETAEAARKAAERSHGQNPIRTLLGFCPRESGTARVKLTGGRYAVPVRIRARSEAEARDMLERVLPGADLLDFVPPPEPSVDLDAIQPVPLPRIGDVAARFAVGNVLRHAAIGDTLAKSGLGGTVDRFEIGAALRQAEGRRRVAGS